MRSRAFAGALMLALLSGCGTSALPTTATVHDAAHDVTVNDGPAVSTKQGGEADIRSVKVAVEQTNDVITFSMGAPASPGYDMTYDVDLPLGGARDFGLIRAEVNADGSRRGLVEMEFPGLGTRKFLPPSSIRVVGRTLIFMVPRQFVSKQARCWASAVLAQPHVLDGRQPDFADSAPETNPYGSWRSNCVRSDLRGTDSRH